MSAITLAGVTKLFGAVRAVDSVDLRIEKGELFFLLGPSGCGKTTLLRTLAGFYYPDEGRVLFGEKNVTGVPPQKRNTGMVFQNYALWPHMSVRQNLAFGLEMRGVPVAERDPRVERALEMVQMLEYADRSPNQLSGGQQQRVALGRALVLEPDVVLMDEPLSNLDAKLRLEMREQIKRLHDELALTMVYVTHDQSEALSMADRVALMKDGRIVQIGAPREIYNRPATRFAADFIGEANLIPGFIEGTGDACVLVKTSIGTLRSSVIFEDAEVGRDVICSIRPERLDVLSDGESRDNKLSGELTRLVYLGNHEQHFVKLADGSVIKAVEYDVDAPKGEEGRAVTVGCDAGDVVLLPAAE